MDAEALVQDLIDNTDLGAGEMDEGDPYICLLVECYQ